MRRYGNNEYDQGYENTKESMSSEMRRTEPETVTGVVKGTAYLRLRKAPGNNEETLKIVREGSRLEIVNINDRFAPDGFKKVKLPNDPTEYWAKSEFVVRRD